MVFEKIINNIQDLFGLQGEQRPVEPQVRATEQYAEHIYVPELIMEELQHQARQEYNTSGVLFYDPRTKKVIGLYETGEEVSATVKSDRYATNFVNRIAQDLDVDLIEYHVHSQGTLNLPGGEYWRTNPSNQDLEEIVKNLNKNDRYKHLLVSVGTLKPLTDNFRIHSYKPSNLDIEIMRDFVNYVSEEEAKVGLA